MYLLKKSTFLSKKTIYKLTILLFTIFFSSISLQAAEITRPNKIQVDNKKIVLTLSEDTRQLLQKEMKLLEEGLKKLVTAYISGDWKTLQTVGSKLQGSYLFKQQLTQQQKKELKQKLTADFIEKDREFHYLAGMLSNAAKIKKTELIGFYLAQVSDACVQCHRTYAIHRFPNLNEKP